MLKVIIIFILVVVVIMTFGSKNNNEYCGGLKLNKEPNKEINTTSDLKKYSTIHSKSIQDDILKSINKNI